MPKITMSVWAQREQDFYEWLERRDAQVKGGGLTSHQVKEHMLEAWQEAHRRRDERERALEVLLDRAASCIADAEAAYGGAFDTERWTNAEIQKRWEFWRDFWTIADPIPREEWPEEYQGDTWEGDD